MFEFMYRIPERYINAVWRTWVMYSWLQYPVYNQQQFAYVHNHSYEWRYVEIRKTIDYVCLLYLELHTGTIVLMLMYWIRPRIPRRCYFKREITLARIDTIELSFPKRFVPDCRNRLVFDSFYCRLKLFTWHFWKYFIKFPFVENKR